jgi:hypothetical protein
LSGITSVTLAPFGSTETPSRRNAASCAALNLAAGQELVVRDPLDLGADDATRDLELVLRAERGGEPGDDAVVLTREQRVHRGQRDVLVRADVPGDDRARRIAGERAHEVHHRCRAGISAGSDTR